MSEEKIRSVDKATLELLDKAEKENITTAFSRAERLKPCPIGVEESCCKICAMGPCRMPRSKKGERKEADGRLRRHHRHGRGEELRPQDSRGRRVPLRPCPGGRGDLPEGGQGRGPGVCHQGRDKAPGSGPRLRRPHRRERLERDRHRGRGKGARPSSAGSTERLPTSRRRPSKGRRSGGSTASSPGASTGKWWR